MSLKGSWLESSGTVLYSFQYLLPTAPKKRVCFLQDKIHWPLQTTRCNWEITGLEQRTHLTYANFFWPSGLFVAQQVGDVYSPTSSLQCLLTWEEPEVKIPLLCIVLQEPQTSEKRPTAVMWADVNRRLCARSV